MLRSRRLPAELSALEDMALDLRWTWSHGADALWRAVDADLWNHSRNPALILENVSQRRLEALARDKRFTRELTRLDAARKAYLAAPTWYEQDGARLAGTPVVYFSMEFGLGDAVPLYAGGLGVLAGDYLKSASDLGLPVVGIGILFQQGYFRQEIDAGQQHDVFPYNDPSTMPLQPARADDGRWLRVPIDLPGRPLWLRVWRAQVGRVSLYLLDGNDPLNTATDRGITSRLYEWNTETRLVQEMILGVGGWSLVEALGLAGGLAHLNEGHAAFAVIERARRHMLRAKTSFREALWATRAGNIFTTHTPVAAGFDRYPVEQLDRYHGFLSRYAASLGLSPGELLGLGRRNPADAREPVNLGYLAARGCAFINAVSRRHAEVSREIFQGLFPQWPGSEVPITHVTNGVHMPTWDAPAADALWTHACGKDRWLGADGAVAGRIAEVHDEALWQMRNTQRADLVAFARARLDRQLHRRSHQAQPPPADSVLDPSVLTLGFARRFASYKRPTLLLRDPARLARLLTNAARPVQIIVAGKAHPADQPGKALVAEWVAFAARPDVRARVVFLEDYDLAVAEQLVRGADVWINTPQPPWEACGTSGMKVLVNGGLNLSQLDGWWAEAWTPEVGWAIGERGAPSSDAADAERLYELLEREVVPEFHDRDAAGLPRRWLARIRASMSRLAPVYSANRMAREYLERLYRPAAALLRERLGHGGTLAHQLAQWEQAMTAHWNDFRFTDFSAAAADGGWRFRAAVSLNGARADDLRVELCAEPSGREGQVRTPMPLVQAPGVHGEPAVYEVQLQTHRPAGDFTPRLLPWHAGARVPGELPLVRWQR